MKIYRYGIGSGKVIELPRGAKVVDAVYQPARAEFSIYAIINPLIVETEKRQFEILSTGQQIEYGFNLIRSLLMPDGFHVFHVVEVL